MRPAIDRNHASLVDHLVANHDQAWRLNDLVAEVIPARLAWQNGSDYAA